MPAHPPTCRCIHCLMRGAHTTTTVTSTSTVTPDSTMSATITTAEVMATPVVNNAVHVQAIVKGVAPYDNPDITAAITALIMSPEDLPTLTVQRILAAFVMNKDNSEDILFDYPDLQAVDGDHLNQLHSKNAEHFKAFYRRYRPVIVDARIRQIMDY